ncbi:MAG: HD domain-containing protein [Candidatus Aminicenantes bacterium]|nr:HD domain-containing protein [Candidatus Aminicenantes bacterium]
MPTKLKVLLVEDSPVDAELALHELGRAGYDPEWKRVETETEFLAQIDQGWEIILADYCLPEFSGLRAIELVRGLGLDLPLIIVSGTIGEDTAVETMRAGANDYIMKDRLGRLGPAIDRELRAAGERYERKRVAVELQEEKALIDTVVEHVPLMVFLKEATDLKFVVFNRAGEELLGYDRKALLGKSDLNLFPPEQAAQFMARDREAMIEHGVVDIPEEPILTAKKGLRLLHTKKVAIFGADGTAKYLLGISEDITEQKKAEKELRESLASLSKALNGTIHVLSAVSEIRDPYTAGHQRRVGRLAQSIAREMGLAPARVEGIRVGGVIHDIGKLAIPAEILSKPTRLSKVEFDLIKSHAQIGYDILRDIDFAWPIAEMARQHHERLDGSGYPQGLKGEAILLDARILAVADVIEAMASHRPYRPAVGIEAALEEIEKNKGLLYDSDAVSACLRLFREQDFRLE